MENAEALHSQQQWLPRRDPQHAGRMPERPSYNPGRLCAWWHKLFQKIFLSHDPMIPLKYPHDLSHLLFSINEMLFWSDQSKLMLKMWGMKPLALLVNKATLPGPSILRDWIVEALQTSYLMLL